MFVTVLPVADGQIIAALVTAVASGSAAFLGVRAANRSTNVVDNRAKESAEWVRIYQLVDMASSSDPIKSGVGLHHLEQSKADWNRNPEQRAFIKRSLEALNAPMIKAYREGKTRVMVTQTTSMPPPALSLQSPGGP
jgi:hypothetical protein